jgi:hypothetical protein
MQLTRSKLTTDYEARLISVGRSFGEDIPVRKWSITTFGDLPLTTSRDSRIFRSPILSHSHLDHIAPGMCYRQLGMKVSTGDVMVGPEEMR